MGEPALALEALQFRLAGRSDAEAIAALHADSWRRHYRGAYADAFLDNEVLDERIAVWSERLHEPRLGRQTIVADDGSRLIAFAHTAFDDDPRWGALLDNLHVARTHQRRGVGLRLLVLTARAVHERETGLYLWVLAQNVDARAFYEACGGRRRERHLASPPGGVKSRLNGSPGKLRYVWSDPAVLLNLSESDSLGLLPVAPRDYRPT
jgi:GNAT superfamily N-acetyltransferase